MNTKVLEHDTRHHPSFVNAMPAIIAEPTIRHVATCHGGAS